ncbi:MAG: gluconokinase [Bacteroidota bacterium]
MVYIVYGVSGVGKTTIGKALAEKLQLPFYDADDFHPEANVEKMKNGHPLNDADRAPWLAELAQQMLSWEQKGGAVLACSALKEKYRKTLQGTAPFKCCFILLNASAELIGKRLQARKDHFMDPGLLRSQFETLEIPDYGIQVDVGASPADILQAILSKL